MLSVEQIDHIALTVSDVERSVAWYREILGLERRHEKEWGSNPAFMYAGMTGLALLVRDQTEMRLVAVDLAFLLLPRIGPVLEAALSQAELNDKNIGFHFEDHGIAHSIYFFDPDGYEIELTTWEV